MSEINSPVIIKPKRTLQRRNHTFKIRGNVFDLYSEAKKRGKNSVVMYKRYFVSPEFIQLFYKIHDGEFDEALFDRLSEKERRELAHVVSFLDIANRDFTIALSKMNRSMYSRMQLIEGAIKAGNLSTELRDEYIDIMKNMSHLGMLPANTASRYISSIHNTLNSHKQSALF